MRIFKSTEYINEKLNIRPVTKDRLDRMNDEPVLDEKTRLFIEKHNLVYNKASKMYDADNDVILTNHDSTYLVNGDFPIKFGKMNESFTCFNVKGLTSLKNSPYFVKGDMNICQCEDLVSLEGATQDVGDSFYCDKCKSLESLVGAPKKVNGHFNCCACNITTLVGAPEYVGGNFLCSDCNNLESLEGAPEYVGKNFDITYCYNLKNFEHLPKKIGGNIIDGNKIVSIRNGKRIN